MIDRVAHAMMEDPLRGVDQNNPCHGRFHHVLGVPARRGRLNIGLLFFRAGLTNSGTLGCVSTPIGFSFRSFSSGRALAAKPVARNFPKSIKQTGRTLCKQTDGAPKLVPLWERIEAVSLHRASQKLLYLRLLRRRGRWQLADSLLYEGHMRELIEFIRSGSSIRLMLSLKQRLAVLFAVALCALPARADSIPGSILIDFETASNGTVITAPIMGSSSKGLTLGTWSTQQGSGSAETPGATPNLTINSSASFPLYTPANIIGTLYDGSGARGMRATMAGNNNNAVRLTFTTPQASLSLGFYFRFNGPMVNWAPRDIVLFQDSAGNFQALQIYDQASDAPDNIPYFHTHQQGSPGVGNNVYFQRNTWYWVTIFRAPAGGRIKIRFYEPHNNYALLGESTAAVPSGTGACRWMTFGAFKYSYNSQSVDFDSMIINTNGVYPLGPGGGPLIAGNEPVIPDSRRPEWSTQTVGVPGGIPNRTTIYTTLNPGGNIQTAVDNCPVGQVVKLNAGNYDISNLRISKSITLRGAGPNSTFLRYNGGNGITIESSVLNGGETALNLSGGYTKGSTNVTTTTSSSNLKVGFVALLDQLNDESYLVYNSGNNGKATWISRESGNRCRSQAVVITAINGTSISFWPPLTYHFTNTMSPQLYFRHSSSQTNNYVNYAGVENLAVTNLNSGGGTGFYMNRSQYCWLSNVVHWNAYNWHVSMMNSFRNEIRHSTFRGTYTTANGEGYGISLDNQTCSTLIEDNIIADNRQFVQVNGGGTGNVVAYNYMTNALASSQAVNYTVKTGGHHNAHPMMNLFEGNVAYKFTGDFTWGSSSHNTVFRNWYKALMPYSSQSGTAFELDEKAQYYNLVGNVIGYPGITSHSGFTEWVSLRVSPASMDYGNTFATFRVGYYSSGGDSGGGKNQASQWNNYIAAGNYEYVAGAQTYYNGAQPGVIPSSYVYASKPAYFGNLAWPPFDPSSPGSVSETSIPAGYRWRHGVDPGGQGTKPLPPSGLRIVP